MKGVPLKSSLSGDETASSACASSLNENGTLGPAQVTRVRRSEAVSSRVCNR